MKDILNLSEKFAFYLHQQFVDNKNYESELVEILKKLHIEENAITEFIKQSSSVYEEIKEDEEVYFLKDPSIQDIHEVALCIPGFYAMLIHRYAYLLSTLNIPLLPRILAEIAHKKTGIDIHPKAKFGRRFFLDHGTGVVVGETTVVGDDVSMYQNVTLGAKSLGKGRLLAHKKRHPTIENHVTIYAGAYILGGDVVVGEGSIIGAGVMVTKSVEPYTTLHLEYTETGDDCISQSVLVKCKKDWRK